MGDDEYFVTGRPSVTTRRAGGSAREKAKEELSKAPLQSRLGRIVRVHTDERAWRRGADGEERIGRILERLAKDWHVFHDLTIGPQGANIDHLAIGPAGVFAVNTKNLTGNVLVASRALLHNGRKTGYLASAVREADKASQRLGRALNRPVHVVPVLAIFSEALTIKSEPVDVRIVRGAQLVKWLERQAVVLDAAQALAIGRAADDPATWNM